jgi:E3 ubiquitin-protein ligase HECTD1
VKRIKSDNRQQFTYTNDFDQNGILYWIGTNAGIITDYTNPSSTGLVSGINSKE